MRFTSCNPALGVLTIPFISLSKPVDPVNGFSLKANYKDTSQKYIFATLLLILKKHSKWH